MPIRAVIFDLFDTLVDLYMENLTPVEVGGRKVSATTERLHALVRQHRPLSFEEFAATLAEIDGRLWRERVAQGRELPTRERFRTLCEQLDLAEDGLAEQLTDVHMGALHEQVAMPDDHPAVLAALAENSRLALCSNFTHAPKAREILEEYALAPHLDVVVVSEDVGIRKPRAEIFQHTLDALGVTAEEAVHVGDNLSADVAGAAALGIRTVWITRRVADPDTALAKSEGPAPDHRIEDLAELHTVLDEVGEAGGGR